MSSQDTCPNCKSPNCPARMDTQDNTSVTHWLGSELEACEHAAGLLARAEKAELERDEYKKQWELQQDKTLRTRVQRDDLQEDYDEVKTDFDKLMISALRWQNALREITAMDKGITHIEIGMAGVAHEALEATSE